MFCVFIFKNKESIETADEVFANDETEVSSVNRSMRLFINLSV